MFKKIFLVLIVFRLAVCERQKRLFSFEFEDRDINIDLDFSIPFLSIPIKKMSDPFASGLPTININPTSMALAGAVVLGSTVLLPVLMKNYASQPGYARYTRLLENTDFSTDAVIHFAGQMLSDRRAFRGCTLRVACWTQQEHYADSPKILLNFPNNKLLTMIVNATAIEDAMLSGRNGRDCESYSPCPIQKQHMPGLIDNLSVLTKYYRLL